MVEKLDGKKITAIWFTGFLTFISLAAFVTSWLRGNLTVSTGTDLVTVLATIVIIILIRGRHFSSAFYLALASVFLQDGLMLNLTRIGTSFALSTIVMVVGIAFAILLLRKAAWGIVITAVLGFVTTCVDYWGPASRPLSDSQTDKIFLAFVGFMILGALVLIIRLWKNFDFATKMVISFIGAALISVISSQIFTVFTQDGFAASLGQVSQESKSLVHVIAFNTQGIMLAGSLGVTLASLLGLLMASVITRQLHKMVREVDQVVNTGDVTRNIQVDSEDEIGQLAVSLQSLMIYVQDKAGTATRLAQGDLTEQVKILSPQDSLGIAFEQMIANLSQAISQIVENARDLDDASNHLADVADMSGKATTQIAETIQQVALGITQEAESINRTSNSVEQMSRAIEGVANGASDQSRAINLTSEVASQINKAIEQVISGINDVRTNSKNAELSAAQGSIVVQTNLEGMRAIKQKVDLSTQKVEEMGRQSQNIGIILETIDDIASQTNMLALNAAIEAARAGEAGKGFAVVADEVRKLAERSSGATKEIDELVKKIQFTVREAVSAMSASTREVELGVSYSDSASEALSTILESVKKVNQQTALVDNAAQDMRSAADHLVNSVEQVSAVVEENTAATEEMSAGSGEVLQAIENISSVSEQNSAAVEEVSASTEEISAQAITVADLAHSAASISNALTQAVAIFRIKK